MSKLSHRAMLMTLTIRTWKGNKTDRAVAAQAELAHGAESGTMTAIKHLTPKHVVQPFIDISRIGREEHYKMTLPGLVTGQALLPTAAFEQYMLKQREIKTEFYDLVETFIQLYPDIKQRAIKRLGRANRASDFPSEDHIRSYFEYSYTPSPVPEARDWRLENIDGIDADELRDAVNRGVNDMYSNATAEVMGQCKAWLEKLESQSRNWNAKAPGATLRDAMLDNMKEFVDIVQMMNINDDPKLQVIIDGMQQFTDLSGAELRKDEVKRKELAKTAASILSKMNAKKRAT